MKIDSVKENVTFRRAYHRGKAVNTPVISVYQLKNRQGRKRLGITVSKKIGSSPARNRIRRIIRAAYRACYGLLPESTDIIIVARSAAKDLKSTDIEGVLREIFE